MLAEPIHQTFLRGGVLLADRAHHAHVQPQPAPREEAPQSLGLSSEGLPLGVQVGAGHGHDELCLQAALLLEEKFGGWVPPTL